jgi:hypothetical protein
MQKLSGTSSGKNNKSCRIFYNESKKIEFAFFWFFYDFLHILQDQLNGFTIRDSLSQRGPRKVLDSYKHALGSHLGPWKDWKACNWVPGGRPLAALPDSGEVAAGVGVERVGGLVAHLGTDLRARRGSRSGRRWWTAAPSGGCHWSDRSDEWIRAGCVRARRGAHVRH